MVVTLSWQKTDQLQGTTGKLHNDECLFICSICFFRAQRHKPDSGTLGINLHLESVLNQNMMMIVYSTYSSILYIKGTDVNTRNNFL